MKRFFLLIAVLWGFGINLWPAEENKIVFPSLEGYELKTDFPVYNPDNLWEYINGGAYTYLNFQFTDLHIAEYIQGETVIRAEVYHQKDNTNAFGIYAQERAPDYHFVNIGVQGYAENTLVNFLKGPYYVKIICNEGDEATGKVLLKLAKLINSNLQGTDKMPAVFAKFPEAEKVSNSEGFIATEFLGYEFMPGTYTVQYEKDGKKFMLFLIETNDPGKVVNDLKTKAESTKKLKKGVFSLKDPYNGTIMLKVSGSFVYGCEGDCDTELFRKFSGG